MEKHIYEGGREAVRPQARVANLVTRELPDEDLIYDLKTHKAHCLNPIAAAVWKQCDGQQTIREIGNRLQPRYGQEVNEEVVWAVLQALSQANLLEAPLHLGPEQAFRQRRAALRRMGIGMLAAPFVTSIIAPLSVQAATCGDPDNNQNKNPNGCQCNGANDCSSDCCGGSGICVAPNSISIGDTCSANCGCVNNCCGISDTCVTTGLSPSGSPCRAGCECSSGSCSGSPRRCV